MSQPRRISPLIRTFPNFSAWVLDACEQKIRKEKRRRITKE
ncbi:TPA: DUF3950 domain-containing protein [Klebsiella pneumoniae]|nr:DUF3950 domain-containing protein [Klebsiella pneumoniae]